MVGSSRSSLATKSVQKDEPDLQREGMGGERRTGRGRTERMSRNKRRRGEKDGPLRWLTE